MIPATLTRSGGVIDTAAPAAPHAPMKPQTCAVPPTPSVAAAKHAARRAPGVLTRRRARVAHPTRSPVGRLAARTASAPTLRQVNAARLARRLAARHAAPVVPTVPMLATACAAPPTPSTSMASAVLLATTICATASAVVVPAAVVCVTQS